MKITKNHALDAGRRNLLWAVVVPLLLLALPGYAQETNDVLEFEELGELPVESVLPTRFLHSPYYSIAPLVLADNNFYRFTVSTDDANYVITSLPMLQIRLFEIVTTASVTGQLKPAESRLNRAPAGRRGVDAEDVVDIFTDPVSTAVQLLGNIEYNVGQTFESTQETPAQPALRNAAIDINPPPHKRSAAAQLNVDVFSSNPQLQEILNAVAAARSAGKAGTVSSLLVDPYRAGPFGTGVLETKLDSHIKNTETSDLHAEVDGSLRELGVNKRARVEFLTHAAYTPRTRLYLTSYATLLKPLKHIDWLLNAALTARTEADAVAYVNYMRMLAHDQLHTGTLAEVITEGRFPLIATSDGNAVLALPLDYLAWTAAVAAAADRLKAIRTERGLAGFIVLLAGNPTTRASAELSARGVDVRPRYSF